MDIIVNVDESVFNNRDYGNYVKEYLDSNNVSYKVVSSISGLISWRRANDAITDSEISTTRQIETRYLLILMFNQLGFTRQLIEDVKKYTDFYHLSVIIYGRGKPNLVQEEELLKMDISFSIFWQFITNPDDLSSFIFMVTKAIAQFPSKSKQDENYKLQNEYADDVNKDVVKVDKNGNGLNRLWRQMLSMFPLASLETAESILVTHPTLSSLFRAYQTTSEPGEKLIQELVIRRARGPLSSIKKLGPGLSRKCYTYFMSENNVWL